MKIRIALIVAACLSASVAVAQKAPSDQPAPGSYEDLLAQAKTDAGFEFTGTLGRLCIAPTAQVGFSGGTAREAWYAPPMKVFDNLYWLGTKIHSSWALTDKNGIIIIDTLYNYAAEAEIVDGLKTLGLDPKNIKYVIVSHGHGDHDEGAKLLQDKYGARIIMAGPDWDAIEAQPSMPGGKPRRDIIATDGQKVTVGENTVTILTTPGHTPGTLSFIFPVKDHGVPMTVAYSGGTAVINLIHSVPGLSEYIASQVKIGHAASAAGASILLSNHSEFDNAYVKARLTKTRMPGDKNPFDVGADGVQRYFRVASECAQALRIKAQAEKTTN